MLDITLPAVVGDPAGMRALASALRADAQSVGFVAASTAATVDGLEFYGPAADRIKGGMSLRGRSAGTLLERLVALAGLLDRAATEVEAAQRARERKLEELRRELAPQPQAAH
jgi:hypothetical protein